MANFGICRAQKVKGALGGIRSHMNREHESKTNPDIDTERTAENYYIEKDAKNLQKRVNERIRELKLKKAPRKDAVKLLDVVVTASPEAMKSMSPEQQKKYFEQSLEFLKSVYGNQNFMYCVVHMDEETPHAHVGFVPVTKDGRLCAKEITSRSGLIKLQDDFFEEVSSKFGLERGEKNNTKRKHVETARMKAETAEQKAVDAEEKAKNAEEEALAAKKNFLAAEAQEQKAMAYVNEVIKHMKLAEHDTERFEEIHDRAIFKEKNFFQKNERVEMSIEDYSSLQTMIKRASKSSATFFDLKKNAEKLERSLAEEKEKNAKLEKENAKLLNANKEFLEIPKKFLESARDAWKAEKAKAKQSGSINQRPRSGSAPVNAPRRGGGR